MIQEEEIKIEKIDERPENPKINTGLMLLDGQVAGLFDGYLSDAVSLGLLNRVGNDIYLNNDGVWVRPVNPMAFRTTFLRDTNPLSYLLELFNASLPPLGDDFSQEIPCRMPSKVMMTFILCRGVSPSAKESAGNHWVSMAFTFEDLNEEVWFEAVQNRNSLSTLTATRTVEEAGRERIVQESVLRDDGTVSESYVRDLRNPLAYSPDGAEKYFLNLKNLYQKVQVTYMDSSTINDFKKTVSRKFFGNIGKPLSSKNQNDIKQYLLPAVENLENISFSFPENVAKQGVSFMCGDFAVLNLIKFIIKMSCDEDVPFKLTLRNVHSQGYRMTLWPRDINVFLRAAANKVPFLTKLGQYVREQIIARINSIGDATHDSYQEKINKLLQIFLDLELTNSRSGTLKDFCRKLGFELKDLTSESLDHAAGLLIEKHKIHDGLKREQVMVLNQGNDFDDPQQFSVNNNY